MGQQPKGVKKTPNQVVAYNLRRIRADGGLTLEEAADRLAPHLGRRMSKQSLSAAETSWDLAWDSKQQRQFSADEIAAAARAFEQPVLWFFTPPEEEDLPEAFAARGAEPGAWMMPEDYFLLVLGFTDELRDRLDRSRGTMPPELEENIGRSLDRIVGYEIARIAEDSSLGNLSHLTDAVEELNAFMHAALAQARERAVRLLVFEEPDPALLEEAIAESDVFAPTDRPDEPITAGLEAAPPVDMEATGAALREVLASDLGVRLLEAIAEPWGDREKLKARLIRTVEDYVNDLGTDGEGEPS